MASIIAVIVIFLGVILFIGGGTLIYYVIYRHNINKRLKQGITHKKGLMSPVWMAVILLVATFFLGAPILLIIITSAATYGLIAEVEVAEVSESMEIGFYTAAEMEEGFLDVYSMEENAGYTKTVQSSGEMEFTCFAAEDLYESYHPHYLVYSDVTGTLPNDAVFVFEGTLYEDGNPIEGYSNIAYAEEMPICIISGMQENAAQFGYELQLICTVFASESLSDVQAYMNGEGAFPEEAVISSSEVSFDLGAME